MRNWIAQLRADRPILFWLAMVVIVFPVMLAFYEVALVGGFWVYWQTAGGMSEDTVDTIAYGLIFLGLVLAVATVALMGRSSRAPKRKFPVDRRMRQSEYYSESRVG